MNQQNSKQKQVIILFFMTISCFALAMAFSETILANYYKEVYQINATQRGILEFPRELPGVLALFVLSALAFLGNFRTGMIAMVLIAIGMFVLGTTTPSFYVMMIFIFIYSMGSHMFMTLQDAIALSLFDLRNIGKGMGQFKSISTACSMTGAIIIFLGFHYGWFSFSGSIRWTFVLTGIFAVIGCCLLGCLYHYRKDTSLKKEKAKLIFRKEYKYYYMLAILHGTQKQIMLVFGPWVMIELLYQGADTIALLTIIGSFIGIFFVRALGKWIDSLGVQKIMYLDALSFIAVYLAYGILTAMIVNQTLTSVTLGIILAGTLFICDRISMQIGMVRSMYLNNIIQDRSELTQTLSTGMSLDHIVTVAIAPVTGYIWMNVGPQYVFFIASALSLINVYIAKAAYQK